MQKISASIQMLQIGIACLNLPQHWLQTFGSFDTVMQGHVKEKYQRLTNHLL